MNVRIINTDEIKLLFQLFDYNDPDEMIAENTRDINKGKIDIFGLFQDGNLIGENHIAYVHSNERFAVTIKKNDADGHSGIFYSSIGFDEVPEWDYKKYDINTDNCLLKGTIDRIRDGSEGCEHNI